MAGPARLGGEALVDRRADQGVAEAHGAVLDLRPARRRPPAPARRPATGPRSSPVAATTSARSSESFAAATSSAVRVGASRSSSRAVNERSRRAVRGRRVTASPAADVIVRGSSRSARGLPCATSRIRSRVRASGTGAARSRTSAADGPSRGPRSTTGKARSSIGPGSVTRCVASRTMRSPGVRRATKASACALAGSIHCTSSSRTSRGFSTAASAEQLERRHGHGVEVGRRARDQTERRLERAAPLRREARRPREQGPQDLVQAGVGVAQLGGEPGRAHDADAVAPRGGRPVEQRGLPDARRAADHQGAPGVLGRRRASGRSGPARRPARRAASDQTRPVLPCRRPVPSRTAGR